MLGCLLAFGQSTLTFRGMPNEGFAIKKTLAIADEGFIFGSGRWATDQLSIYAQLCWVALESE
jgi:hypothetical protein